MRRWPLDVCACAAAGVELLAEGLAANGTLVSLDLSNNAITCDGAIALAEALHSDKCCLAELQLANNKIGELGA
jgi:Ran GTPase-activating protein (RanGAP) involved in mRNA processing and transport